MSSEIKLSVDDTFAKHLPMEEEQDDALSQDNNAVTSRQVFGACGSFVNPKKAINPEKVHVSGSVAQLLGINPSQINTQEFVDIFSGNRLIENTKPFAMAYGGHQFGQWAGQLGDGRATNLAEILHDNKRWAIQLKGAGKTPYSRNSDGLAVLRSSVREHLCSEAMHHLGVPTTRSLSLLLTGESVLRDMFYDGNAAYEKGAVVCRVAPSFLRFGNFQLFTARQDKDTLETLLDYTISHFYADINAQKDDSGNAISNAQKYELFFQTVVENTMAMIIHWQRVGFVHGVMNSDNMSILGLTIDYGPYGWTDNYDDNWTPNTTDSTNRRYSFGNQAPVALWNLWQLANALLPMVENGDALEASLHWYQDNYPQHHQAMVLQKLGLEGLDNLRLDEKTNSPEKTTVFVEALEVLLQQSNIDMTIFYRQLAYLSLDTPLSSKQMKAQLADALYDAENVSTDNWEQWLLWLRQYQQLISTTYTTDAERKQRITDMNAVNPKYVLRNYMAQLAIDAADNGDYSLVDDLYTMLKNPYQEQPEYQKWFAKRPGWAKQKAGCSMLSCSS